MDEAKAKQLFHEQLAFLRKQFAASLPGKFNEVQTLLVKLQHADESALRPLLAIVHKMSGSGATFGYPSLSKSCKSMELLLNSLLESGKILYKDYINQLISIAQEAQENIQNPLDGEEFWNDSMLTMRKPESVSSTIKLLFTGAQTQQEVIDFLNTNGFEWETIQESEVPELCRNWEEHHILFTDLLPDYMRGQTLNALSVYYFSVDSSLDARITASHYPLNAFLPVPFSTSALLHNLENQFNSVLQDPYKVLIIEDDSLLATHYQSIFIHSGMSCRVTHSAHNLFETLDLFYPDVLLLDLHLGTTSGWQIAAMIRMHDVFFKIPVIMLSAESDRQKQLEAIAYGADSFLTKPIKPQELLGAVLNSARKNRRLLTMLAQDSLTGLYNQAAIRQLCKAEIDKSLRHKTPLALAMLDLDYFKKVNDTYGHSTGDKVLMTLASILKNRFRKSDLIGRYGGEEFVVVFPHTTGEQAAQLIDELRKHFESKVFEKHSRPFKVTFSAGVAELNAHKQLDLFTLADTYLYQAKELGRNLVIRDI
jgi:diguanylate cyclase (GGDEF)-like protein